MRLLLLCLALGVQAAAACGFHEDGRWNRGMLNLLYPGAMSVGTSTWMAQREGLLAADAPAEKTAQERNAFGLLRALAALRQWKMHIEAAGNPRAMPTLSVVLMGPMLWSRYESRGDGLVLTAHAEGPVAGDVVVVTEAAVLGALASERLTLRDARDLGLIAFYGDADAIRAVIEGIGP
jgi:hypothetical protein